MSKGSKKIIFVDRDGVINIDPIGDYVKSWSEFRFEPTAIEGLKRLYDTGYGIIVISNQAGIGDGVFTEKSLRQVHENMTRVLEEQGVRIEGAEYCLHGKNEGCSCRKPEIGLFERAVKGRIIDKGTTFFIGDKATDMQAGKRFGLKTAFVRTGHGRLDEPRLKEMGLKPDIMADNLLEAAKVITA